MKTPISAFQWRGQPSEIAKHLPKHSGSAPPVADHPLRNGTTSIAGAEKRKQKPGVGRSATV